MCLKKNNISLVWFKHSLLMTENDKGLSRANKPCLALSSFIILTESAICLKIYLTLTVLVTTIDALRHFETG